MARDIPTLAIMGHPNAGKSSVVATLTENDRIEIDQRAGTTTRSDRYPVAIDGDTVIAFIDTPGFQNPSDILEWFQAHEGETDLASAFVEAFRRDPMYSHDVALLEPVADGGGIILVVDGSKRIKEKDRTEMELLRLTGRPRMAILNNLSNHQKHLPAWQDALSKSFNAVREFNAHRATYSERIKLLNALKSIDQRWEPQLEVTIDAFRRDWERRIDATVTSIIGLLREALSFRVNRVVRVSDVRSEQDREEIQQTLQRAFQDGLRRLENDAQQQVRGHFRHHVWNLPPDSLLQKDLFSDEVGRALGLNRLQMSLAGAAAGATTGVGIDLSLAGGSLGAGLLIGATAGSLLGALGGAALAKVDIQRTLGVERFSLGPITNQRFPFILLDRILLYCARAMNWSHGRKAADDQARDRVPDRVLKKRRGFSEELSAEEIKTLARFFADLRKGKDSKFEDDSRRILAELLRGLSSSDIDSRAEL
jgi:GTP-binding protein EngB required for normal cell division